MNHSHLTVAAALLDDIGSGTLGQGDFYLSLEQAGMRAADLCKFMMHEKLGEGDPDYAQIMLAASCLKNICCATDNEDVRREIGMAKTHAENLYRINEKMEQ